MADFDAAVLIGRFQPFHNGHAQLLKLALDTAPRVILVLGSSFHAPSVRNPFRWQERAAMITASLTAAERQRIGFVPVRDYYDDRRWAAAVGRQVRRQTGEDARIALVGHFKDASSAYLKLFPSWRLLAAPNTSGIDATPLRRMLFEAEAPAAALQAMAAQLPAPVLDWLDDWVRTPVHAMLAAEHAKLEQYKAAWRAAPYPPVFVTVDALVRAAGQVLLVRRGGFPGKGLWALPGGFLDPHERLLAGALRELREETAIALEPDVLEAALANVQVFDHPGRSQRGRTVTHAHFFDLGDGAPPAVQAADDAADARWVPQTALAAMEEEFYEDHFHMLDHFLDLTGD